MNPADPAAYVDREKTIQVTPEIKFSYIRLSPRSLYLGMEGWMNGLGIKDIISHEMSESNGYITISVFYR